MVLRETSTAPSYIFAILKASLFDGRDTVREMNLFCFCCDQYLVFADCFYIAVLGFGLPSLIAEISKSPYRRIFRIAYHLAGDFSKIIAVPVGVTAVELYAGEQGNFIAILRR